MSVFLQYFPEGSLKYFQGFRKLFRKSYSFYITIFRNTSHNFFKVRRYTFRCCLKIKKKLKLIGVFSNLWEIFLKFSVLIQFVQIIKIILKIFQSIYYFRKFSKNSTFSQIYCILSFISFSKNFINISVKLL